MRCCGYVTEVDVKFLSSIKSLLKSASLPNVFGVNRFSQGNTKRYLVLKATKFEPVYTWGIQTFSWPGYERLYCIFIFKRWGEEIHTQITFWKCRPEFWLTLINLSGLSVSLNDVMDNYQVFWWLILQYCVYSLIWV